MTKFILYTLAEINDEIEHIAIDSFDAANLDAASDHFCMKIDGDLDEASDEVDGQFYFSIGGTSYIICAAGELPIHD